MPVNHQYRMIAKGFATGPPSPGHPLPESLHGCLVDARNAGYHGSYSKLQLRGKIHGDPFQVGGPGLHLSGISYGRRGSKL